MNLLLTMTAARMAFFQSAVPAAFIALTHKITPACSAPAPTLRKPSQHANPPAGFLCMSILFETTEVIILNANIIALSNQKGGTGKTTTCANLGIELAQEGKRALVVDNAPQASSRNFCFNYSLAIFAHVKIRGPRLGSTRSGGCRESVHRSCTELYPVGRSF